MTGFDGWAFLDRKQVWVISGWSAMSYVAGTTTRMTALQENSRHYFQRPDASHVEVDPDATSLTGYGSRYWLNKQKGNGIFNAALGFMDPKFDVSDLGFQPRSDVINGHIGGGYKWTETTKSRKYQEVLGSVFGSFDFQGNPIWAGLWAEGATEFINNYSWNYSLAYNPRTVSNRGTRGGPLMINVPGYEMYTYFDTDGKAKLFYFVDFYGYTQPESGSYNWNVNPGVEWKPVSNVAINVGPGFARNVNDAQYVDTVDDATATQTYGRRYVFGEIEQTTVSANLRLNWAFTPTMSLISYTQGLISSGKYADFKSLARPKTYEFDPYAYGGNPDFNFRSLRGNAVFRWEYLPGSTMFLVWTQERSAFDPDGDFRFGHDLSQLTKAQPNNIFLAKVSYYFTL
jgi:hypothetical protein